MRPAPVLAVAFVFVAGCFVGWKLPRTSRRAGTDTAVRAGLDGIAPAVEAEAPRVAAPPRAPARISAESHAAPPLNALEGNGAPASASEPASELSRELCALLNAAEIEAYFAEHPEEARDLLCSIYLELGRPELAIDLLRRHSADDEYWYQRVAEALASTGQVAAAALAYEDLLEIRPFAVESLQSLARLDPQAALDLIDRKAGELGPLYASQTEGERARALLALGRREEALASIEKLLAVDTHDTRAWEVLTALDPALAERRLRELASQQGEIWPSVRLAELMLGDDERRVETTAVLEDLLQRHPGQAEALAMLQEIDADRALAHLASTDLQLVDTWTLSRLGEELYARGRAEEAIQAWLSSLERNTEGPAAERMREFAPERLNAFFESISAGSNDDEQLGDIADSYWRQGLRDRAVELWNRAHRIDPSDGEWIENLQAVFAGEEPL